MYYTKEETPLLAKNAPLENVAKKFGQPPPPHLDKIQKDSNFFSWNLPLVALLELKRKHLDTVKFFELSLLIRTSS